MSADRTRLYTSLRRVFDEMEKNQRLVRAGVRHFWGKIEKQGTAVGPRVYWLPRRWKFIPPRMTAYFAVLPDENGANREVRLDSIHDKQFTVDVWLYAEQGRPEVDIEDLLDLYGHALRDVLLVESDYSFEGDWSEQDALSVATDHLRGSLTLRIPLVDMHRIARAADDNVSLRDS